MPLKSPTLPFFCPVPYSLAKKLSRASSRLGPVHPGGGEEVPARRGGEGLSGGESGLSGGESGGLAPPVAMLNRKNRKTSVCDEIYFVLTKQFNLDLELVLTNATIEKSKTKLSS